MTRISVCMATYNGAFYLREQIESILPQLMWNDELIVSDDRSVDDTRSIVSSYEDNRIRLIINDSTRGHVNNFANAIASATGEYIALSDQDDIWVEHRLERMVDMMQGLPRYSLVVGDFTEFDQDGQLKSMQGLGPSPEHGLLQLYRLFLGRAKYFGSAFLFRRDLLRFILPIPPRIEAHDVWIAMNACLHGRVRHLQETTLMRRIHVQNLTPKTRRDLRAVCVSRFHYFVGLMRSSVR